MSATWKRYCEKVVVEDLNGHPALQKPMDFDMFWSCGDSSDSSSDSDSEYLHVQRVAQEVLLSFADVVPEETERERIDVYTYLIVLKTNHICIDIYAFTFRFFKDNTSKRRRHLLGDLLDMKIVRCYCR